MTENREQRQHQNDAGQKNDCRDVAEDAATLREFASIIPEFRPIADSRLEILQTRSKQVIAGVLRKRRICCSPRRLDRDSCNLDFGDRGRPRQPLNDGAISIAGREVHFSEQRILPQFDIG